MNPFISIIIPTFQRPADLRICLGAILPQLPPDDSVEVLVCDDGRDLTTQMMVKKDFPSFYWLQGPQRGPAANRNLGVREAKGEWLIFVDDDCIPATQWLAAYLAAIPEAPPMLAFEGATWRMGNPPSLLWEAPHNPRGGALISCNFAIRKADFLIVGKFDERYPVAAFEDTEFEARFVSQQGKIKFLSEARVDHPLRPLPASRKLAKRWEGRIIFAFDQGASNFRVLWGLPWHVFRVIQSRFKGQPPSLKNAVALFYFIQEWFWVLILTPQWAIKWGAGTRSHFWTSHTANGNKIPKYGF